MRYEIAGDEEDKRLILSLSKNGSGDVTLMGVDNTGRKWHLLVINTNGTVSRIGELPLSLGLALNRDGRIAINDKEV